LSCKELGPAEYQRRRHPNKAFKKRWTGLSAKQLGHTAYVRQWRKLRREMVNVWAAV